MKTIYPIIILAGALIGSLTSLAPSLPPGSPVVAGPAVVAIHVAQGLPDKTIKASTNVVAGITNVVTAHKLITTNYTINTDSLMALLENSFNTNFPPGSRLLLTPEGPAVYNFIVSDSTGTNFGFDPSPVLSATYTSSTGYVLTTGVTTQALTNSSLASGEQVETDATALKFTYDDSAMNPTDHTFTHFTWSGLLHDKFSENLASGFRKSNVTIDITGTGSIRDGGPTVFTGTIHAKVAGVQAD